RDVPPESVVEAVKKSGALLCGLSALMTTTVGNMQTTISDLRTALKKAGKSCAVMAGGAVLTADYAAKIGADYYVKDAMASVAVAKEIFG
ncbi:MAG: cobalamin-dependent protein, partial [Treponemataceae bacterium]|nr:cobalamin-dependent protein [Treponemataceae bacterium]